MGAPAASDEALVALLARARAGGRGAPGAEALIPAILGRPADRQGLAHHSARLAEGQSPADLVRTLLASPEFRERAPEAHRARVRAAYAQAFGADPETDGIRWFHSIRLPDGRVTDGRRPHRVLAAEAEAVFPADLAGRSVLDIGAWDGFFSFEAERRGAGDVLATDHFCWSGPGWGTKAGFDHAHAALASRVRAKDVDVFALDPEVEGRFDLVLFLGVLYHLRDPFGGLARAAAMARDTLVVETVTALDHLAEPALRHFPGRSLDDDPTNHFAPNTAALGSMLRELGFREVAIRPHPLIRRKRRWLRPAPPTLRHIAHARR